MRLNTICICFQTYANNNGQLEWRTVRAKLHMPQSKASALCRASWQTLKPAKRRSPRSPPRTSEYSNIPTQKDRTSRKIKVKIKTKRESTRRRQHQNRHRHHHHHHHHHLHHLHQQHRPTPRPRSGPGPRPTTNKSNSNHNSDHSNNNNNNSTATAEITLANGAAVKI